MCRFSLSRVAGHWRQWTGVFSFSVALELAAPATLSSGEPTGPVVWEIRGPQRALLGSALRPLDDIDGDGVPELVVTAPGLPHVPHGMGYVSLLSGRDGEVLRRWSPVPPIRRYGISVDVVGDLDGDGHPELAIHSDRAVEIVSPLSGDLLHRITQLPGSAPGTFDHAGNLGDVDGDGVPDFFRTNSVFWTGGVNVGRVAAHSGATGRLLWEIVGSGERPRLGHSAAAVGDVTADGIPDLVVGQPNDILTPEAERQPGGRLIILSGRDGSEVESYAADPELCSFGSRDLVLLGDIDDNGRMEIAVSAYWAKDGLRENIGWVGVFEIPGFRHHYGLFGVNPVTPTVNGSELGYRLAAAGDLDLDGVEDLLLSTNNSRELGLDTDFGRLYLRSGRTGALLEVYEAVELRGVYFSALSPLGDVDGDGRPEFAIASLCHVEDEEERGVVQVLRYEHERIPFQRGDANRDGRIDISDVVEILRVALGVHPAGGCPAVHDTGGQGIISTLDALLLVRYLFGVVDRAPVPPLGECGRYSRIPIPTVLPEPLDCREFAPCP